MYDLHWKTGRLRDIKKFDGEPGNFVLNSLIDFKPTKRFTDRSGVSEFWSFDDRCAREL